jgi:flagellum-specific peptidoglycan hydrolase FlgJ
MKGNQSNIFLLGGAAALALYFISQKNNESGTKKAAKFKGTNNNNKFKSTADYIKWAYPYAKATQDRTTVPASVNILISAVESEWGKHPIQNNYHGIKADNSWRGNKTVVKTPECIKTNNTSSFHAEVLSVVPPNDPNAFKACSNKGDYTAWINDGFRAYSTPAASFLDFGTFLQQNIRYKPAFAFVNDPKQFGTFILTHGYSTAQYVDTFLKLLGYIEQTIKALN